MITTSSSYRMKGARSDHAEDEQERRQSTGKNLGGAGSMTLTTPPVAISARVVRGHARKVRGLASEIAGSSP